MTGWKKISGLLAATLVVAMVSGAPAETENPHLEKKMDSNLASVIMKLMKRLPDIWRVKREAAKIAPKLAYYNDIPAVPDSETIFSWIKGITATPHRRPGTPEGHIAEDYVSDQFRKIGLENVTMDPISIKVWTAKKWSLHVDGKEIPSFFVVNTGFTGAEGLDAEMVYVGTGTPEDFKKVDVKGKIVVADVPFPKIAYGSLLKLSGAAYLISDPSNDIKLGSSQYLNFLRQNFVGGTTAEDAPPSDVYWQSYKKGAIGILLILRDQPSNSNTHYGPYDGIMKPLPGLWIGKYDGEGLRESAKSGAKAKLVLDGNIEDGTMRNVWGVLPGMSDEVILVTSHHDSPFQGAIEDGAGSAQVLAQAAAWSKVPKEKRPRTLVFVIDAGHFYGSLGAHTFARNHPEIMKKVKILITLEHLAGKEVIENKGEYAETGKLNFTVIFTSHDPLVVASLMRAFDKRPPKVTAAIPYNFFGDAPTSDAAGYVIESKVPVISWIGCPYYLLDSHDTLDKVEVTELNPIAQSVAEIVGIYMVMK